MEDVDDDAIKRYSLTNNMHTNGQVAFHQDYLAIKL